MKSQEGKHNFSQLGSHLGFFAEGGGLSFGTGRGLGGGRRGGGGGGGGDTGFSIGVLHAHSKC